MLLCITLFFGNLIIVKNVCGVYHDDGIYVVLGKALSEENVYRLISLPDSPVHYKYPIIYPFFLSIVWNIWPSFPENLLIMQYLNIIFGALFVSASYLFLTKYNYVDRSIAFLS